MKVIYTEEFKRDLKKVRDKKIQNRIKEMVEKIKNNPTAGKPLKYNLSGFRSVKIPPFSCMKSEKI